MQLLVHQLWLNPAPFGPQQPPYWTPPYSYNNVVGYQNAYYAPQPAPYQYQQNLYGPPPQPYPYYAAAAAKPVVPQGPTYQTFPPQHLSATSAQPPSVPRWASPSPHGEHVLPTGTGATNVSGEAKKFAKPARLADAKGRLARLCDEFDFLKCKREPSGQYLMKGGTYGAGVFADLVPGNGYDVYKNANAQRRQGVYTPITSTGIYMSPAVAIPVFVKVMQDFPPRPGAPPPPKSDFQIEADHTRTFARRLHNNHPIGPDHYDVVVSPQYAGIVPAVPQDVLYQGLVNGITMFEAARYLVQKAYQRTNENVNVVTLSMFRLFQTIFEGAALLWKQRLVHCDLHLNNMMIVAIDPSEIKRDPETYRRRALAGQVLLAPAPTGSDATLAYYAFSGDNVRFIDLAFLSRGDPAEDRNVCFAKWLSSRTPRSEDVYELWRGGVSKLCGNLSKAPHSFKNHMEAFKLTYENHDVFKNCKKVTEVRNDNRRKGVSPEELRELVNAYDCSLGQQKSFIADMLNYISQQIGNVQPP